MSVNLTQEEADLIRQRRNLSTHERPANRQPVEPPRVPTVTNHIEQNDCQPDPLPPHTWRVEHSIQVSPVDGDDAPPPPLPPKPKQKISQIGSPNTDQFIVMDNSALFVNRTEVAEVKLEVGDKVRLDGHELTRLSGEERRSTAADISSPEPHSRSDSGLSSLSSWTAASSSNGHRSGSSSVRSSSIVSNSSAKLEELLGGQKRSSSIVSSCSMKLEELEEKEEGEAGSKLNVRRESKVLEKVKYFQTKIPDSSSQTSVASDVDSLELSQTSKETGVQRQLATIKHQKEKLIKDIVENEKVGLEIQRRLEAARPGREVERLAVFLCELEKVVLLLLSLCWRLERAEEELSCGNLTDWEKESIRYTTRPDKHGRIFLVLCPVYSTVK